MTDRFNSVIEQEHLIAEGQRVLLAVSGGRDSVVLCHLFAQSGIGFGIAHCNFNLRPHECDRDEQFVRRLAESYGVQFHLARFDTLSYAKDNRLSVEEAARQLRYDFFEQVRSESGYDLIATAHHADDAVETFFINLLRGTGISGLHGIKLRNGNVIRPLLQFSRDDINSYVSRHSLQYVDDSTNFEPLYMRNKIRLQLLPLLRQIQPDIDGIMRDNISRFADVEAVYQAQIEQVRNRFLHSEGDTHFIELAALVRCDDESVGYRAPVRTYLFELLRPFGFNPTVCSQIVAGAGSQSGRQFFSSSHRAVADRDRLIVTPLKHDAPQASEIIIQDVDSLPYQGVCTIRVDASDGAEFNSVDARNSGCAWFDCDRLAFPLTLRHWRNGDRFVPFGMKGSRLVSDLFTDLKLSIPQKESVWILCDADGVILSVVGHRASSSAPVTPSTRCILSVCPKVN